MHRQRSIHNKNKKKKKTEQKVEGEFWFILSR